MSQHAQQPDLPIGVDAGAGVGIDTGPEDGDPRFVSLVAQVARRLRPSCAEWEEQEFQALVRRIARMKVRWDDAFCPDASRSQ